MRALVCLVSDTASVAGVPLRVVRRLLLSWSLR